MSDIHDWSPSAANNNAAPPDGFPENMNYSEVNDGMRELMAAIRRRDLDMSGALIANRVSDGEFTITLNTPHTSYFDGMTFRFHITTPSPQATQDASIAVNGLPTRTITDLRGNTGLPGGTFTNNRIYTLTYIGGLFRMTDYVAGDPFTFNAAPYETATAYSPASATISLNLSTGSWFYPSAEFGTSSRTFTFVGLPPSNNRVVTVLIELQNAANPPNIFWPSSVDWGAAGEPAWSSGTDFVSLTTRDRGTNWHGFLGKLGG